MTEIRLSRYLSPERRQRLTSFTERAHPMIPDAVAGRWVWMSVEPLDEVLADNFRMEFAVPRTWLKRQATTATAGGFVESPLVVDEWLQMRFAFGDSTDGHRESNGFPMSVMIFGQQYWASQELMQEEPGAGLDEFALAISSVAQWSDKFDVENPKHRRLHAVMLSGSFKIWTRKNLNDFGRHAGRRRKFLRKRSSNANLQQLLNRLWPAKDANENPSAVYVGAHDYQLDIARSKGAISSRTRIEPVGEARHGELDGEISQLYRTTGCPHDPDTVNPDHRRDEAVSDLVEVVQKGRFPFVIEGERSRDSEQSGVFFRVTNFAGNSTKVETIIRPGISVVFTEGPTRWSPRSLTVTQAGSNKTFQLSSIDKVGDSGEADLSDPGVKLKWKREGTDTTLSITELPTMLGRGISGEIDITNETVWVRAPLDWSAAGVEIPLPTVAWTAVQLLDHPPSPGSAMPGSFERPIIVNTDSGYTLELTPRLDAEDDKGELQLTVTKQASPTAELSMIDPHVAALTPPLDIYRGNLPSPRALPNVPVATDSVKPGRLRFSSEPTPTSISPRAQIILQHDKLFELSTPAGSSAVDAVTTYVPYPTALIENVSWSRENQSVRIDPTTGQVTVDRDVNVGLTAWHVKRFRIDAQSSAFVVEKPEHVQMAEAAKGVLAELPYIFLTGDRTSAGRPDLDSEVLDLFYRSLLIERGEFAVAAEDRLLVTGPSATPYSDDEMVRAVRDAFSCAAKSIGNSRADAVELMNWLPGSMLSGEMTKPAVWMETPVDSDHPAKLIPRVHLVDDPAGTSDGLQMLRLFAHEEKEDFEGWLRFNTRWHGFDPTSHRPKLELKEISKKEEPNWPAEEVDAGVAPLLFFQTVVTAIAAQRIASDTVVLTGDQQGRLALRRFPADQLFDELAFDSAASIDSSFIAKLGDRAVWAASCLNGEMRAGVIDVDSAGQMTLNEQTSTTAGTALTADCWQALSDRVVRAHFTAGGHIQLHQWKPDDTTMTPISVTPSTLLADCDQFAVSSLAKSPSDAELLIANHKTSGELSVVVGGFDGTDWSWEEFDVDSPPATITKMAVARFGDELLLALHDGTKFILTTKKGSQLKSIAELEFQPAGELRELAFEATRIFTHEGLAVGLSLLICRDDGTFVVRVEQDWIENRPDLISVPDVALHLPALKALITCDDLLPGFNQAIVGIDDAGARLLAFELHAGAPISDRKLHEATYDNLGAVRRTDPGPDSTLVEIADTAADSIAFVSEGYAVVAIDGHPAGENIAWITEDGVIRWQRLIGSEWVMAQWPSNRSHVFVSLACTTDADKIWALDLEGKTYSIGIDGSSEAAITVTIPSPRRMAVTSDNAMMLVAGMEGHWQVIDDVSSGSVSAEGKLDRPVSALAFDPADANRVLVATAKAIHLIEGGATKRVFDIDDHEVASVSFGPAAAQFAILTVSGEFVSYAIDTGSEAARATVSDSLTAGKIVSANKQLLGHGCWAAHFKGVATPKLTNAGRDSNKSSYLPEGEELEVSFSRTLAADSCMVRQQVGSTAETTIGFACRDLRIVKTRATADGTWYAPLDFDARSGDNGSSAGRGPLGDYGFFSTTRAAKPIRSTDRLPRLCGIPVDVLRLRAIRFADDGHPNGLDIELRVPNPQALSGATLDEGQIDPASSLGSLRIQLDRKTVTDPWNLKSVPASTASRPFLWRMPSSVQDAARAYVRGFSAYLETLAFHAEIREVEAGVQRLVLSIDGDACQVALLSGRQSVPGGQLSTLVGIGKVDQIAFVPAQLLDGIPVGPAQLGEPAVPLPGVSDETTALATCEFDAIDTTLLASGSGDGEVIVSDARSGYVWQRLGMRVSSIQGIRVKGANRFVTAASNGAIELWNESGEAESQIEQSHHGEALASTTVHEDGGNVITRVLTAGTDRNLRLWQIDEVGAQTLRRQSIVDQVPVAIDMVRTSDLTAIAVGDVSGAISVYLVKESDTGEWIEPLPNTLPAGHGLNRLRWRLQDDQLMLVASGKRNVWAWSAKLTPGSGLPEWTGLLETKLDADVVALDVDAGTAGVLVGLQDGRVERWLPNADVSDSKEVVIETDSTLLAMTIVRGREECIVTLGEDGMVSYWDLARPAKKYCKQSFLLSSLIKIIAIGKKLSPSTELATVDKPTEGLHAMSHDSTVTISIGTAGQVDIITEDIPQESDPHDYQEGDFGIVHLPVAGRVTEIALGLERVPLLLAVSSSASESIDATFGSSTTLQLPESKLVSLAGPVVANGVANAVVGYQDGQVRLLRMQPDGESMAVAKEYALRRELSSVEIVGSEKTLSVAFASPRGTSSELASSIGLMRLDDGVELAETPIPVVSGHVVSLSAAPSNRNLFLVLTDKGIVELWKVEQGNADKKQTLADGTGGGVNVVNFSVCRNFVTGDLAALVSSDGTNSTVRFVTFTEATSAVVFSLTVSYKSVAAIDVLLSPDGEKETLLIADSSGDLHRWERSKSGGTWPNYSGGSEVIVIEDEISVSNATIDARLVPGTPTLTAVVSTHNKLRRFGSTPESPLLLIDLKSKKIIKRWDNEPATSGIGFEKVLAIPAVRPHALVVENLGLGETLNRAQLWDLVHGGCRTSLSGLAKVHAAKLAQDGGTIALCAGEKVQAFSSTSGEPIAEADVSGAVTAAAADSSKSHPCRLAVAADDNHLRLADFAEKDWKFSDVSGALGAKVNTLSVYSTADDSVDIAGYNDTGNLQLWHCSIQPDGSIELSEVEQPEDTISDLALTTIFDELVVLASSSGSGTRLFMQNRSDRSIAVQSHQWGPAADVIPMCRPIRHKHDLLIARPVGEQIETVPVGPDLMISNQSVCADLQLTLVDSTHSPEVRARLTRNGVLAVYSKQEGTWNATITGKRYSDKYVFLQEITNRHRTTAGQLFVLRVGGGKSTASEFSVRLVTEVATSSSGLEDALVDQEDNPIGGIISSLWVRRLSVIDFLPGGTSPETHEVISFVLNGHDEDGESIVSLQVGDATVVQTAAGSEDQVAVAFGSMQWLADDGRRAEIQGPMLVQLNLHGSTILPIKTLPMLGVVYPVEPAGRTGTTNHDIVFDVPKSDGVSFDLSPLGRPTQAEHDNNLHPQFVEIDCVNGGADVRQVRSSLIPIELCLEPDDAVAAPTVPADRPTLDYRSGIGPRLRLNIPDSDTRSCWDAVAKQQRDYKSQSLDPADGQTEYAIAPAVRVRGNAVTMSVDLWQERNLNVDESEVFAISLLVLAEQPVRSAEFPPIVQLNAITSKDSAPALAASTATRQQVMSASVDGIPFIRRLRASGETDFELVPFLETTETAAVTVAEPSSQSGTVSRDPRCWRDPLHSAGWTLAMTNGMQLTPYPPHRRAEHRAFAFRRVNHQAISQSVSSSDPNPPAALRFHEATAFIDPPHPKQPTRLGLAPKPIPSGAFFLPAEVHCRIATDKPGAMIHHEMQMIERLQSNQTGDVPSRLAPRSMASVRDPQKLVAPVTTSVQVDSAELKDGRLTVKWRETLASLPRPELSDTLTFHAVPQPGNDPGDPSVTESIQFDSSMNNLPPFALYAQVNQELAAVDAATATIPFYEAASPPQQALRADDTLRRKFEINAPILGLTLVGNVLYAVADRSSGGTAAFQVEAHPLSPQRREVNDDKPLTLQEFPDDVGFPVAFVPYRGNLGVVGKASDTLLVEFPQDTIDPSQPSVVNLKGITASAMTALASASVHVKHVADSNSIDRTRTYVAASEGSKVHVWAFDETVDLDDLSGEIDPVVTITLPFPPTRLSLRSVNADVIGRAGANAADRDLMVVAFGKVSSDPTYTVRTVTAQGNVHDPAFKFPKQDELLKGSASLDIDVIDGQPALAILDKSGMLTVLTAGSPQPRIESQVSEREGQKQGIVEFAGTDLQPMLITRFEALGHFLVTDSFGRTIVEAESGTKDAAFTLLRSGTRQFLVARKQPDVSVFELPLRVRRFPGLFLESKVTDPFGKRKVEKVEVAISGGTVETYELAMQPSLQLISIDDEELPAPELLSKYFEEVKGSTNLYRFDESKLGVDTQKLQEIAIVWMYTEAARVPGGAAPGPEAKKQLDKLNLVELFPNRNVKSVRPVPYSQLASQIAGVLAADKQDSGTWSPLWRWSLFAGPAGAIQYGLGVLDGPSPGAPHGWFRFLVDDQMAQEISLPHNMPPAAQLFIHLVKTSIAGSEVAITDVEGSNI